MAAIGRQLVSHDLTAALTEAYGRVLVAGRDRAAAAAAETARADRELAGNRRDAGLVPTRTSCSSTSTFPRPANSRFGDAPTNASPAPG